MPSLTDKIKGKFDEAKQKAEKLKEQAKAKAQILKLRAEAASVIVKAKPLLLKEKTWSKDRGKKIGELAKKADELKDDKVGTLADLLKKHAASYLKAIDQQIKLIKDVSVLNSPPEEIQKFIVDMKTWVDRADHYYDLYRTNKVKLRQLPQDRQEGLAQEAERLVRQGKANLEECGEGPGRPGGQRRLTAARREGNPGFRGFVQVTTAVGAANGLAKREVVRSRPVPACTRSESVLQDLVRHPAQSRSRNCQCNRGQNGDDCWACMLMSLGVVVHHDHALSSQITPYPHCYTGGTGCCAVVAALWPFAIFG